MMDKPCYTPREMIARMVSFDTTSSRSNLELIHFVRDYLAAWDVDSHMVPNEDGTKANLYAAIGPQVEGGVVLSGHTDVVPVEGQPWDTDPWQVVEKDGRLYGRGTADMKSFSSIVLAKLPELLEKPLTRPLILALSYDEEIGCFGAPRMIRELMERLPKPALCIVGEPSMMGVVNAHKGIATHRTSVTGFEAHSAHTDKGVNAVAAATRLAAFLHDIADDFRSQGPFDERFDPVYTTLGVNVINGGTAHNIVARECSFVWDCRTIPGMSADDVLARLNAKAAEMLPAMRSVFPGADIVTERLASVPGLAPEDPSPAAELVHRLTGRNSTETVSYASEGGQFQEAGLSTVICGPGSILQAHQPNEFIALSQIEECDAFISRLADWASA